MSYLAALYGHRIHQDVHEMESCARHHRLKKVLYNSAGGKLDRKVGLPLEAYSDVKGARVRR